MLKNRKAVFINIADSFERIRGAKSLMSSSKFHQKSSTVLFIPCNFGREREKLCLPRKKYFVSSTSAILN